MPLEPAKRKAQELKAKIDVQELKVQQLHMQERQAKLKVQELQAQLARRGISVKRDTPRPRPKSLEQAPRQKTTVELEMWAQTADICDECGKSDVCLRCPICNTCACAECDASEIDSVDFNGRDCSLPCGQDYRYYDATTPLPLMLCSDALPISSLCVPCRAQRTAGMLP